MSNRLNTRVVLALGLSAATITLVAAVFSYKRWRKRRQENVRRKFLFGNRDLDDEDLDKKLKQDAIKKQILEAEEGTQSGDSESFRPASERIVTSEIVVPRQYAREFVGNVGCNIQKIQQQTNTRITNQRETLQNGDRTYTIHGSAADVRLAELEIQKFIMSQPPQRVVSINVPTSAVGRIIGRQGQNINSIQEKSGARVKTAPKDSFDTGLDDQGEFDATPKNMTTIIIRGTDDQIEEANSLIQDCVREEELLRSRITASTTGRTKRRPGPLPVRSVVAELQSNRDFPLKRDGSLEVFVSCIYNPNNFWIQMVGKSSVDLDRLCEAMTEYYIGPNSTAESLEGKESTIQVGDNVAAVFEVDKKIYRGRVLNIKDNHVKVFFLDYGDQRDVHTSSIYQIRAEDLKLQFQGIEATLNLNYQEEWSSEIIDDFVALSHCSDWVIMVAKVKDYLREEDENRDIIWIELFEKSGLNVGDELIRLHGLTLKNPEGKTPETTITSVESQNPVRNCSTYASVVAGSS